MSERVSRTIHAMPSWERSLWVAFVLCAGFGAERLLLYAGVDLGPARYLLWAIVAKWVILLLLPTLFAFLLRWRR